MILHIKIDLKNKQNVHKYVPNSKNYKWYWKQFKHKYLIQQICNASMSMIYVHMYT